ncbi:hypothetical protein FPOA_06826 [Fusarium poae]|uniref:RING-type domain-containing protein n=1 Tax=Fusarium poae TaxID=36050 RepID=A0A1B8AJ28_FUSPO|nr:hypothetical protein FPOA_06826 [Fusarium poae]
MTKETYWPVLKSSLLNGGISFKDLDLDCPICYDNIGVHPNNYGPKDEYGHNHRAIILACGHTVGEAHNDKDPSDNLMLRLTKWKKLLSVTGTPTLNFLQGSVHHCR